MGPGGIQTSHAITLDTRDMQPSHIGILDPLATPEGPRVGITMGMAMGVRKQGQNFLAPVMTKAGKKEYWSPIKLYTKYIGFPDEYVIKNKKVVAKNAASVKVQYKGKVLTIPSAKVDAYIYSPQDLFSIATNLVPFIHSTQGNRASTAARMISQAMSLKDKETPLVQVKDSKRGVV